MDRKKMKNRIEILVDECGAPVGAVANLQTVLENGTAIYTWGGSSDWESGLGCYRILNEDDQPADYPLLRNIAEQFVILYETEVLDLEYFYSAFRDALGMPLPGE